MQVYTSENHFTALYVNGDDKEAIGSQDTTDIDVIILMFPNLSFSGEISTCLQCEPVVYGKICQLTYTLVFKVDNRWCCNGTTQFSFL